MKIGITERGDASRNLSWVGKLSSIDGVVLVTKNIDSKEFQNTVLKLNSTWPHIIIHATITGMGGTWVEPNVSCWEETVASLISLSNLFPPENIVLRIDPIIPTEVSLKRIEIILRAIHDNTQIRRIRFSFIDNYKHIKARGIQLPWNSFNPPIELQQNTINMFKKWSTDGKALGNEGFKINSCGEDLSTIPEDWKSGCISGIDLDLMKLETPKDLIYDMAFGKKNIYAEQRPACKCLRVKTELFTQREPCHNRCLYCYWK